MRVTAGAAIGIAALALIALALADARSSEAHHLCGATGSPQGPFGIETYEAGDYRTVYGQTIELAALNQLFPNLSAFAVPKLNSGMRNAPSQADPYIPPVLLKAIASIESSWAQADYSVPYGGVGSVLASHDCGYGIMQITSGMQNVTGVPNLEQAMIGGHYAFNIARGAYILADKWNMAPQLRPIVGNADPKVIENWYFALWAYNGFAFQNHPLNPAYSPQRVDFSCGPSDDGFGHDRTRYPYQELVMGCVKHPPHRGGQPLWQAQNVHMPDLSKPEFANPLKVSNWSPCSQQAQCAAMDIPTPNTSNQDQTQVTAVRDDVLGSPAVQAAPSSITLTAIPSATADKRTVTISNSGTGVLAYRVSTSATWIKVSRRQGVALGSDIGTRNSSFVVEADLSGMAPGTYNGEITIESLHANGAPRKIPVTVTTFPDNTLVRGSGSQVYIVKSGVRRWIPNPATFEANGYSWGGIVRISDSVLSSMPVGNPVFDVLSDGNLIVGRGAPEVYVMEDGKKRHVAGRSVMSACGYSFGDIYALSAARVSTVPGGEPLTGAPCPAPRPVNGALLRGNTSAVYVMRDGVKRHIPNAATLDANSFRWGDIDRVGQSWLNAVPTGNPLPSVLANGMLLKSPTGSYFIMSNGAKRLIDGGLVMSACGYTDDGAHGLAAARLNQIPNGSPLVGPPCPTHTPPNGRLLKGSGSAIYVMAGGLKRHIPNPATFQGRGFLSANVDTYADFVVNRIPTGKPLLSVLADGNLVKGSGDALFVMHNGQRRPISLNVMSQCGYSAAGIYSISDSRLLQIPLGPALQGPPCPVLALPNGALITGSGPEVYVAHDGQKRHITSRAAFDACGYRWGDVDRLPAAMVAQLPTGQAVNGPPCP